MDCVCMHVLNGLMCKTFESASTRLSSYGCAQAQQLAAQPKASAPSMAAIAQEAIGPAAAMTAEERGTAGSLNINDPEVAQRLEGTPAWQQLMEVCWAFMSASASCSCCV